MTDMSLSLGAFGCAFGGAFPAPTELTAFRGLKIAKRRLRPEVGGSLIDIYSCFTDGTFRPSAWRFTFRDRATRGRLRSVIVAAHVSSEHPGIQEAFKARKEKLAVPAKLIESTGKLIDSDKALAKVQTVSDLRAYCGVVYHLLVEKNSEPVWHLSFYGQGEDPAVCFRLRGTCGSLLPLK